MEHSILKLSNRSLVNINNYYILQEVNEDEEVEEEHHGVEVEEEEEVVLPQQEQTKFRSMPVEPEPTRKNHLEMIKRPYKYQIVLEEHVVQHMNKLKELTDDERLQFLRKDFKVLRRC